MLFAFSTDDKTLMVYASEAEVTAYVEGTDVEDGGWLFFDDHGLPLGAVFITPNQRERFSVVSGSYRLQPSQGSSLSELLPHVALVEGKPPLNTVAAVADLLASNISVERDAPQSASPLAYRSSS